MRLICAGERLTDPEVDQILKYTGTEEDLDGNVKYEGNERILLFVSLTKWSFIALHNITFDTI